MLRVKSVVLLVISAILLLIDWFIITPDKITYAQKPILAFLGILFISFLDEVTRSPDKTRKRVYYSIVIIFAISLVLNFILKTTVVAFPFLIGCFIQSFFYLRRLRKVKFPASAGRVYEAPLPDVGFKIMSGVLFIRDLILKHKKLLEFAGIKDGYFVLDYGCGPGAFTFAASKIVGEKGVVYALDNQHLAIEAIEAKIKESGISNVKTIYTNQGETGLPDNSIDYVLLIGVLHLIRNPKNVLEEIKRVMKNDARILVVPEHMTQAELFSAMSDSFRLESQAKQAYIFTKSPQIASS